jgi:hypothetical protein
MSPKHAVCHPPRGRQTLMKTCRSLVGYMPIVGFFRIPTVDQELGFESRFTL